MCSCAFFKRVRSSGGCSLRACPSPAVLSTWVRGALCSPFLVDTQIGWQVLLMSDQTVYSLISKHNMIQRCQELFNVHPDPGLCEVSSPAYPLPPGQSFPQVGALKKQFSPLSFPVPARQGPWPSSESRLALPPPSSFLPRIILACEGPDSSPRGVLR